MSKDKETRNSNMIGAGQTFKWQRNEQGQVINRSETVREQGKEKKPEQTWSEHIKPPQK
jgi:hypothetical protein